MWAAVDRLGARVMRSAPRIGLPLRAMASRSVGEAELSLLPVLCDRSKLSIDIGANFGVYSYRLVRYSADVVAFEPNPQVARMLSAALPRVRVEQCALGGEPGTATLHMPQMAGGSPVTGFGSLLPIAGNVLAIDVPVKRLDDFGFQNVGFIKIDVEGFEPAVLDGGWATIERERPNLLVEAGNQADAEALAGRLGGLGYSVDFYHDGGLRPLSQWSANLRTRFGIPPFNFVFRTAGAGV